MARVVGVEEGGKTSSWSGCDGKMAVGDWSTASAGRLQL